MHSNKQTELQALSIHTTDLRCAVQTGLDLLRREASALSCHNDTRRLQTYSVAGADRALLQADIQADL